MDVETSKQGQFRQTLWFWSVAGFFAAIWVLLPSLLHTGYRNDVSELQSIAPEWVWATKKHPMLPAWVLETLNIFTNRSFAAPFIASQLCTLLALWSVWKLGRTVLDGTVLDERLALIGAFSVLPYRFFTNESVLYNQNNVLIAFWCLSIYLVFQAFQTNQERYWITAGIALGLTFQSKYPAVFLVLSILAYVFMRAEGRKYIRTPGPYITALIAFLIFLPHLIWLAYHDFAPLSYASESRPALTHWYLQLLSPFRFAAEQTLYWIPTLIILIPVLGFFWRWRIQHHEQSKARECEKFLFYCFMIPLLCHMLYCGIKGVHLRMAFGAPFWVFGGLWLLLRFQQTKEPLRYFRQTVILTFAVQIFIIAGWLGLFYSGKQGSYVYYPMCELGEMCEQLWHYPIDCPYIASDNTDTCGFAAYAMRVRPSVIMPQGTWATDDRLKQKGGLLVWERIEGDDLPVTLRDRFPQAQVLETSDLPYKKGKEERTLKIGVAVVPPPDF
jgi:hypothetical protein